MIKRRKTHKQEKAEEKEIKIKNKKKIEMKESF
jgi:hypothetical protein